MSFQTLQILSHLPDPDQELYIQRSNDLTTFTLFPELPREIRNIIWRETFPAPRHIVLAEFTLKYSRTVDPRIPPGIQKGPDIAKITRVRRNLPVALSVSQESRNETLRHYTVVPIRHSGFSVHPDPLITSSRFALCFRMGVNSASLSHGADISWLSHLKATTPGLLAGITRLEVTSQFNDNGNFKDIDSPARDFMALFPGLKVLLLTVSKPSLGNIRGFTGSERNIKLAGEELEKAGVAWLERPRGGLRWG